MTGFTEIKRQVLAKHLRKAIRGEVCFDRTSRLLYSTDASIYQIEPLAVVIPKCREDIVATVQIAGEMEVPITPRGGGTSLSGQSIGPGIILDCSKYLNAIRDLDPDGQSARVEPGVVLDQLNHTLAGHGLQFGPEVATASRANLGGMIGNNSAGARSIVYGKTIDHVRRLQVVLSDGSEAEFAPAGQAQWVRSARERGLTGTIYQETQRVVEETAPEIAVRFPKILRRVSGYNLDVLAERLLQGNGTTPASLADLIVGSEGTLAVVTEADIGLIPRPRCRGLLVPHFSSLAAAMQALAVCLELKPSAVELIDQMMLDLARENLSLRQTMAAVRGRPAALYMVEFSGDEPAEVADRVEKLRRRLDGGAGVTALVPAIEPALRDPLWSLRTASMPLLYGIKGDQKPVTFVEDTAVAPERLPEFVSRFQEVLKRHGTAGAFYGHASVGCLHIRPLLNLKEPAQVERMRRIMEEITDLVLEFGGALSGEHGDGLARSEWNLKMFGPKVYEAFRQIKRAFDPRNILNPGKVVNAPAMTENLRYPPGYAPYQPTTLFDYGRQEGFVRSIELCNGSGACRKLRGGTMCPSFRATRDEKDSTRGRANALRNALAGEQPLKDLRSPWLQNVLDLCLMCKACKSECPSNVDLAKLKAEALQIYYEHHPRPLSHYLMAHVHTLNGLAARAAPLTNRLQSSSFVRWLLERVAGIDRRRSLPSVYSHHFRRWFARRTLPSSIANSARALLLDDCFTTYHEPAIGKAAVRVLESAGFRVELAGLTCCCRPLISKGFLRQARELIQIQSEVLAPRLPDNVPLLGLEPSCILTLADEWPELVDSPETRRVAAAARLAEDWLLDQVRDGGCAIQLNPMPGKCLVHGHCHQKALVGVGGTAGILRLIPDLEVQVLDTGCCGMAGSFGYEKDHYDLSVVIAELELLPAVRAEPDALIAAPGTSCRHQIKDLAERSARHPLELVAESLALSEK